MCNIGKGFASFSIILVSVIYFLISLASQSVQAMSSSNDLYRLDWLPLLSTNIKKLQPDITCPKNTINDLQVNKSGAFIRAQVGKVSWDLDCIGTKTDGNTVTSENINSQSEQLLQLFKQLSELPDFELKFLSINLISRLIKTTFSSSLALQKKLSSISAAVNSKLLDLQLDIDSENKQLTLDLMVRLGELANYFELTEAQSRYLNNDLIVHYQSPFKALHKGEFTIDWSGKLTDISDTASLSIEGHVDLLTSQVVISDLLATAQQVEVPTAEKQSWKTGYIKLKNISPILLNYSSPQIEKLPLSLRIGKSHILTRVERGKSKRIRLDKQSLPPLLLQLDVSGNEGKLLVDWALAMLNQKLRGKVNIKADSVRLEIVDNSINIRELVKASVNYSDNFDSIEIESGEIKLNLSALYQIDNGITVFESSIISNDISGKKEDVLFDGINVNSHFHYHIDAAKKITIIDDQQQVDIQNLFVGIPIQALKVEAKYNAGEPVVQHFKARLLGGRLDFDDFKLNAPSQTLLNLSGISLPEVLKYSAYPEIQTQGILDGMLPLMLTDKGVEISEGLIFARPPGGYIKVPENTVIKAMGRGNPAFSFTMQLLSNFQFDTMQGIIGYTDDGESDLKIEINGISPTVSGTQPINFNYSHNENILKLLQSLRFNEQLERDIKERY
jgi:hypothetical protein